MDRGAETKSAHAEKNSRQAILDCLRSRNRQARFVTELNAFLRRLKFASNDTDRALAALEAEGAVIVRDHFCADPHLAGADLRVAALVEAREGEDAQLNAIRSIDQAWNKWLSEYLANHRCG